jgi:hypothetical protein
MLQMNMLIRSFAVPLLLGIAIAKSDPHNRTHGQHKKE